jgi:hypothetical protein
MGDLLHYAVLFLVVALAAALFGSRASSAPRFVNQEEMGSW